MRMPHRQCVVAFAPFSCAFAPLIKSILSSEFTLLRDPEMVFLENFACQSNQPSAEQWTRAMPFQLLTIRSIKATLVVLTRGRAHRDHYRLAHHLDRSPHGRGRCRAQLS